MILLTEILQGLRIEFCVSLAVVTVELPNF